MYCLCKNEYFHYTSVLSLTIESTEVLSSVQNIDVPQNRQDI